MQRIDENTYIDDTLVTCAEYQLFIDEMREQGKYYQPDHWTSYQFKKGQARKPILGIRHSDAVAFCEWLTKKNQGEWKFCLPRQTEADAFPIKPSGEQPLGYWIGKKYRFAWIGSKPLNACHINSDHYLPNNINIQSLPIHALTIDHQLGVDILSNDHFSRAVDLDCAIHYLESFTANDQNFCEIIDNLNGARELSNTRETNYFHYLTHAIKAIRELLIEISNTVGSEKLRSILIALENENNNMGNFLTNISAAAPILLDMALNTFKSQKTSFDLDLIRDFNFVLDSYIDLFFLRERIAGRSPAFEGIRLVKERIR